jgi:hypothetical protein
MGNHSTEPLDLDAFFAAEIEEAPAPSQALMSAVLADAMTTQAAFQAPALGARPALGLWAAIGVAIGGWPAVTGLAAATVAGVWIGVSPPQGLDTFSETVFGSSYEYSDYLPVFDNVLTEG